MTTEVGDKGLVFSAGTEYSTFSTVGTPIVGDKVILYPLGEDQKLAVPNLTFSLTDAIWVIPCFKFAGFDWKFDWWLHALKIKGEVVTGTFVITGGMTGSVVNNDTYTSSDNGATWVYRNASWWPAGRRLHNLVTLKDNSLLLTGGMNDTPVVVKKVFHSEDLGLSWYYHTDLPYIKDSHSGIVQSDGSVVLVGGWYNNIRSVYRSEDDGITWTTMTATPEYSDRIYLGAVRLSNDNLIVMGGRGPTTEWLNDVWISINNGATWTQQTAAAGWNARRLFGCVCLSDNTILVIGGDTDTGAKSDVWKSTDGGINWTMINASAGWGGYGGTAAVTSDDRILFIPSESTEVWFSNDKGVTWTRQTTNWGLGSRTGFAIAWSASSI
jgi:hypothetical protein